MLKIIFNIVPFLSLSACYYSFETGCLYVAQSVDCFREKSKSNFDSYFQEGVDDKQKLLDMKDCLGIYGDGIPTPKGDIFYVLQENYPDKIYGENSLFKVFDRCMKNRGYIFDSRIVK